MLCDAGDVVWTGGAGPDESGVYQFGDPGNWDVGRRPTDTDVAIFRPTGSLTINPDKTWSGDTKIGSMRFESGSTYFMSGNDYWYMMAPTTEVYVASGAFASLSNMVSAGWGDRKPFIKTGSGTAEFRQLSGTTAFALKEVIVKEGVLQGTSNRGAVNTEKITVCAGATYATGNDKLAVTAPEVELEATGTLLLNANGGQVSVVGLHGSGRVTDAGGGSRLLISPTNDCLFCGTIEANVAPTVSAEASGRFVIGATNVFEHAGTVVASRRLSFASGVPGPFVMGEDYRVNVGYPLELTDLAGQPVTAIARIDADIANFRTSGLGSFYSKSQNINLRNTTVLANKGFFGQLAGTVGVNNLFDVSQVGGFDACGGELKFWNANLLNVDCPVKGSWPVSVTTGPVQFGNLCLKPVSGRNLFIYLYADCTMTGGVTRLSYSGISYKSAGKTFTLAGGELDFSEEPSAQDITMLPVRRGLVFDADASKAGACFRVSGTGEMWLGGYVNCGVPILEQTGGTIHWAETYRPWIGATAESPSIVKFDGGTVYAAYAQNNFSLFADDAKLRIGVGTKGGCFRQDKAYYKVVTMSKTFSRPLESMADGVDGGASFYGFAPWDFPYAFSISGPLKGVGGTLRIPASANLAGNPLYFGTGDMILENEQLVLASRAESTTLRIGTSEGKGVTYIGCVVVCPRTEASAPGQAIELGPLTRGAGGALFLWDATADIGTVSTIKAPGIVTQATGRVSAPIFGFDGTSLKLLEYDNATGFRPLTGIVTDETLADVEGKVARVTSPWTVVPSSSERHLDGLVLEKDASLALGSDSTVYIGDGTNPGVVVMNNAKLSSYANASVDFGMSEGVVAVSGGVAKPNDQVGNGLMCTIKGQNGLSYVAAPDATTFKSVNVTMPNLYQGDTRINAVAVRADHVGCFSTGDVYVGDGERYGGRVTFNVTNGVWANDFHVAGFGNRRNVWNERDRTGAFVFLSPGEVSGDVELTSLTRMSVYGETVGVISGVVSGDRLQVFDSPGILKLTNSNTYTGGTEVVAGTLALVKADSAGAGAILLDGGTLRFENTEPIVFSNEVRGVGTVVFAGTAPVTLCSSVFEVLPFQTFTVGTTLDFPNFTDCTLKIGVSGDVDLGGRTISVSGIAGSGRISNGTLVVTGEINPGGIGTIGTLTFETAPVVNGATLVCELSDSVSDKLVVEDDFVLSALAFEAKKLTSSYRCTSSDVVETTGTLSGAFRSTTFPHGKYAVTYAGKKASLIYGGLIVVVR